MTEHPLSEMSDAEIIAAIGKLRERRAQARERRIVEKTEGEKKIGTKGAAKVSDALWNMLSEAGEETEI